VQGRDRELLKESHDAYIEKSNRPNVMMIRENANHHERPPPLTEGHGFAEFSGLGSKSWMMDPIVLPLLFRLQLSPFGRPNLRMAISHPVPVLAMRPTVRSEKSSHSCQFQCGG